MSFTTTSFLSGLLLLATMQMVPAPPLLAIVPGVIGAVDATAAAVGAAAAVGSTIENAFNHKRNTAVYGRFNRRQAATSFGNVQDWKNCHTQLAGHFINFAPAGPPGAGNTTDIVVSGLPSACITWAGDVTGKIGAGNPVPVANNAVKITGLSQEDISELQDAITSVSKPSK